MKTLSKTIAIGFAALSFSAHGTGSEPSPHPLNLEFVTIKEDNGIFTKLLLKVFFSALLLLSVAEAHHLEGERPAVTLNDLDFAFQDITKDYAMAATETTQRQWALIMRENPSHYKESWYCDEHRIMNGVELCPNYPVESITLYEIQDYIEKLNALYNPNVTCGETPKTSQPGCFRLPLQEEWEYARTDEGIVCGSSSSSYLCNWRRDGEPHNVALYWENSYGLHDMYGNVGEHVLEDWRNEDNPDPYEVELLDMFGPRSAVCGGTWKAGAWDYISCYTGSDAGNWSSSKRIGFRLVRAL